MASKYIKDENTYCNSAVDGIWSAAELSLCVCVLAGGGGLVPRGVVRGTGNNKIRNIVEHHQGDVLEGNSGSLKRSWLFCKIMSVRIFTLQFPVSISSILLLLNDSHEAIHVYLLIQCTM